MTMADKDIQKQIDEINGKLDEILVCATQQRLRSARLDDLVSDLSKHCGRTRQTGH